MFKKIMGFLTDLLNSGRKAGFWQKDQGPNIEGPAESFRPGPGSEN